jgi:DNA gyrase subunit A
MNQNPMFETDAPCVGGGFVAGTLVLTRRGLIPIEQVDQGDVVFTQLGTANVIGLNQIPERDVLKVTLENGTSVAVTPDQSLRVINADLEYDWKRADKVLSDDYIVLRASYPKDLEYILLPDWNGQSIRLDEDLAYVIGQFLSDGWYEKHNSRFVFQSVTYAVIKRIQDALLRVFDYNGTIEELVYQVNRSDGLEQESYAYKLRINAKALNMYLFNAFHFIEAPGAVTKRIPSQFFQSSRSVLGSLFSGLVDGDGSVRPEYSHIHYGTVSPQLADDVQLLLQHLGIFSTRYILLPDQTRANTINGRTIQANHTFYAIEIDSRYAQDMGRLLSLSHETKHQRIQKMLQTKLKVAKYDRIPYAGTAVFQELSRYHIGAGWYQDQEGNKFRMGIKYPNGSKIRYSKDLHENPLGRTQIIDWGISEKLTRIGSSLSPFLRDISAQDTYFLRVANTHFVDPQVTYNLQVSSDNEFIANGIISSTYLI